MTATGKVEFVKTLAPISFARAKLMHLVLLCQFLSSTSLSLSIHFR